MSPAGFFLISGIFTLFPFPAPNHKKPFSSFRKSSMPLFLFTIALCPRSSLKGVALIFPLFVKAFFTAIKSDMKELLHGQIKDFPALLTGGLLGKQILKYTKPPLYPYGAPQ